FAWIDGRAQALAQELGVKQQRVLETNVGDVARHARMIKRIAQCARCCQGRRSALGSARFWFMKKTRLDTSTTSSKHARRDVDGQRKHDRVEEERQDAVQGAEAAHCPGDQR